MQAGRTRKFARAFKRQTGRLLHDDQHRRPVCQSFAVGDRNPTTEKTGGIRDAVATAATDGENNRSRQIEIMKKTILMLMSFVVIVMALGGCQPKTDENNKPPVATNGVTDATNPVINTNSPGGTNQ